MDNTAPHGNDTNIPEFTLGDRLRKARTHRGLSVDDVAAVLGVSDRTVRNYESETTPIRRDTAIAWAFATGVPFEWLWGGQISAEEGPPIPPRRGRGYGGRTAGDQHSSGSGWFASSRVVQMHHRAHAA